MNPSKTLCLAAFGAASLLTPFLAPAAAQAPGAANTAQGYDAFKFVKTRNIFDPNRRPARVEQPRPQNNNNWQGRQQRENYIALTGTMVTPEKKLAFFNGARSEYNKVLGEQGKIADFTITKVMPTQVEFTIGGKPVVVQVGSRLPLNGSSAASATPDPEAAPPAADAASPASDNPNAAPPSPAVNSNAPAPSTASGPQSDVARRMMEKRQKELSSK